MSTTYIVTDPNPDKYLDCRGNEIHPTDTLELRFPDHCPDSKELWGRKVRIKEIITHSNGGTFLPKGLCPVTKERFSKKRKTGIHIPFSWTKIVD